MINYRFLFNTDRVKMNDFPFIEKKYVRKDNYSINHDNMNIKMYLFNKKISELVKLINAIC